MNFTIRKATLADAPRLLELRRHSILELAPAGMSLAQSEAWAAKATSQGMEKKLQETEIWIAEVTGSIVAWVSVRGDYLEGLYTDPQFAERGIGSRLLGVAEKLLREQGVPVIRADASWNAEEFYLRRGYEPTGPRPTDGPRPLAKRLLP